MAMTAAVLNKQLPKPADVRFGFWNVKELNQQQITYAAADAWASLRIYQNVDSLVRPGDRIEQVTPGLFVEIRLHAKSSSVIARGHILEQPESNLVGDVRITPGKQCLVRVKQVLVPAAIAAKHQLPLSSFGRVPFDLVVPLSFLRTSVPFSVAEVLKRLSEQDAEPLDAAGLSSLAESLAMTSLADDDNDVGTRLDDIIAATDAVPPSLPSPTDSDGVGEFTGDDYRWVRYVLDDPYHVMARIRVSRLHGAALQFAWAFRDAIFVADPAIKQKVSRVLEQRNTTYEKVLASNPAWIHARVPRRIPRADKLFPVLHQLFEQYADIPDARTGKPLFDSTAREKQKGVLRDVLDGYLSDPPGIELYHAVGKDMDGLTIYRCLRGTNSVEGGVHQNIIRMFQSFNASPQLAVGLLSEYVLRHNLTVLCRNTTGRSYKDHFDIWQTSDILSLYDNLSIERPERYKDRMNLNEFEDTHEVMFIAPIPAEVREELGMLPWAAATASTTTATATKERESQTEWLARRHGCAVAATPIHTKEEKILFRQVIPAGRSCHQLARVEAACEKIQRGSQSR